MSTVVVTGAAGFVGGHLTEHLLRRGDTVIALDVAPFEAARHLQPFANLPELRYRRCDIRDAALLSQAVPEDIEVIYHLASVVGVRYYMEDVPALIDVIINGTRNLAQLAVEKTARMVFSSTSEIYGRNPSVPWPEDGDRVLGATSVERWSYSSCKAVCEHMLFGMRRTAGLDFTTTRFFNVYGPRQRPIYVVSQSIHRALRGEPPYEYDSGRQTRCFTYIDDVIGALVDLGWHEKASGEAFNIGNPREHRIHDVIAAVIEACGTGVAMENFDTKTRYGAVYEDIDRRVPDVTKARRLIGWEARTPVDEGIRRTVAWARVNQWWLDQRP